MKARRIKLKKLKNTRDLGGYATKDGRKIKHNMLIRSGHLAGATENDIAKLMNEYKLKTVIDLRIDNEIAEKPDNVPESINHIRIPLLDKAYLGITRDEYSLNSWFNLFPDKNVRPEDTFYKMYEMLVFSERSKKLIPEIFSVFLNGENAVLWHCSAGKDRVGMITMLMLLALDVDKETIVSDFLATNRFSAVEIYKTRIFAPFVIRNRWHRRCLGVLMGVKREYMERMLSRIEADFADTFDFFEKTYGIDREFIIALRKKYLE